MLRTCVAADMPAITEIYQHHVPHGLASFETAPPSLTDMCRRRADIHSKGLPYLVADMDETIAGYAYAGTYRPRAAYRDTVENSVYLRHDMARLDSALMQRALGPGEATPPGRRED